MAFLLSGKEVAAALDARSVERVARLREIDITPTLAIIRVGEKQSDLSYERGAMKRCAATGITVNNCVLQENASTEDVVAAVKALSNRADIHGILILRPLPKGIDDAAVRDALSPHKDVDGITDASLAGVFSGAKHCMTPCTAQACMEILDYYRIDCESKRAVVVGRSLVVGKPVAMLLTGRDATVTVCHTKTQNTREICRDAEIVIAAAGRANLLDGEYFSEGQIAIDVGINFADGKLTGDILFEEAEKKVKAITPVPGGVGAVTTSVLVAHTIDAAEDAAHFKRAAR